jgi:hypothetical protein
MNKIGKRILMACTVAGVCLLFFAAGLNASGHAEGGEGDVPEVITMKNEKAFEQHRMGIVDFKHKAHVDEYGLGCGDCHHDENGEPLTDLEWGDDVQSCYECHDKNGRPRRDQSMSPQEWQEAQLEYFYGAIHENCMGCHKKLGGPKGEGGPVGCTDCHPRPQR